MYNLQSKERMGLNEQFPTKQAFYTCASRIDKSSCDRQGMTTAAKHDTAYLVANQNMRIIPD